MSQHDAASFFAGALLNLLGYLGSNAAESCLAVLGRTRRGHEIRACFACSFRDDDNAEGLSASVTLSNLGTDAVVVERNFRNQDHVGAASQPSVNRDPTCIASHHFQNQDSPVAFRGAMEPVQC